MSTTSRREFLKLAAATSGVLSLGGLAPPFLQTAAASLRRRPDAILVVIQLTGGNDGLNTVVPKKDETYYRARPTLSIPADRTLAIDEELGFHPSLRGLADLLESQRLTIIQGVGYPQPNRSHFESMDIWHSCHRKDARRGDGWLGRFLETPPAAAGEDAPACHVGGEPQPLALASSHVRSPSLTSLEEFRLPAPLVKIAQRLPRPSRNGQDLLGFLQTSMQAAVRASQRLEQAVQAVRTTTGYPPSDLARKLQLVAQLIDAGLQTRIYYVALDGFDTHAQQADAHAALLKQWSEALAAFENDLAAISQAERVLIMSFSEFGRRVAENASGGTDHGAAAPMFLAGPAVRAGVIGRQPSLADLDDGDLRFHTDFRSVYAGVLEDWLGSDSASILGGQYEPVPAIRSSS